MIRPVLAREKSAVVALAEAAPRGARVLSVAEADTHFAPGDWIFISEADDSELEFLGAVTAAAAAQVSTSLPVRNAKSANALVWKAVSAYVWPAEPTAAVGRDFDTGVMTARALGGGVFAARVAEPRRIDRLQSNRMSQTDFDSLRNWIEESLRGGLLDFTYVDERGGVSCARLASPQLKPRAGAEGLIALEVEIAILAQGDFAG